MEALPGKSLVQLDLFPESKPEPVGLADHERALQVRYDTLAAGFRLPPARVVISTRRATGGAIQYGPPHLIRISGHMSVEDRLQTLLHEVAHAICHLRHGPEEGHSRRFWAVARQLGVERKAAPETDRLRLVRTANARYAYRCVGCGEEWMRRKPFGRARLCAACERGGRPARLVLIRRPSPRRRAGS